MVRVKNSKQAQPTIEDLLRDLIIINLAQLGMPQQEIRSIVGGDIRKVNRIAKHFKKGKK